MQVSLGFANFYRRFIKNYAKKLRPLSNLLVGGKAGKFRGPFVLTEEARLAFERLKTSFTKAPILRHWDPERPSRLETDSSDFAIGGILSQQFPYVSERMRTKAALPQRGSKGAVSRRSPDPLKAKRLGDETPMEAVKAVGTRETPDKLHPGKTIVVRALGATAAGNNRGEPGESSPKAATDSCEMGEPHPDDSLAVGAGSTTAAASHSCEIHKVKSLSEFRVSGPDNALAGSSATSGTHKTQVRWHSVAYWSRGNACGEELRHWGRRAASHSHGLQALAALPRRRQVTGAGVH